MKTPDEIIEMVVEYGRLSTKALMAADGFDIKKAFAINSESLKVLDSIRAALTASMDWKGMDSAPKDGTRILLCADGLSTVGFWIDEQEDQVDVMGADAGFVDVDYQNFWPGRSFGAEQYQGHGRQPTGWNPLPPPRAEGEK